jgi:primosomal protein N''
MKEAGNLNVLDFLFGRLMAQLKALRKLARVKKVVNGNSGNSRKLDF